MYKVKRPVSNKGIYFEYPYDKVDKIVSVRGSCKCTHPEVKKGKLWVKYIPLKSDKGKIVKQFTVWLKREQETDIPVEVLKFEVNVQ